MTTYQYIKGHIGQTNKVEPGAGPENEIQKDNPVEYVLLILTSFWNYRVPVYGHPPMVTKQTNDEFVHDATHRQIKDMRCKEDINNSCDMSWKIELNTSQNQRKLFIKY